VAYGLWNVSFNTLYRSTQVWLSFNLSKIISFGLNASFLQVHVNVVISNVVMHKMR
jgi:hypothetical protein